MEIHVWGKFLANVLQIEQTLVERDVIGVSIKADVRAVALFHDFNVECEIVDSKTKTSKQLIIERVETHFPEYVMVFGKMRVG